MNYYAGNMTCPVCGGGFKEGEAVKQCDSCRAAYHQECWNKSGGCITPGCPERPNTPESAPAIFCAFCGNPLKEDQTFCPKCGAMKNLGQPAVCGRCGARLQDGQEFCAMCGQRAVTNTGNDFDLKARQFNAGIEKKKKKKKVLWFIIPAIVVVAALAGFFIINAITQSNIQKAKAEYLSNVETFVSKVSDAGTDVKYIADTVQQYWYDSIYKDMYGSDINNAISQALYDLAGRISSAGSQNVQVKALYNKVKDLPEGVTGSDIEEIRSSVRELYNAYNDYYNFAIDPSGSYNSFSADNGSLSSALSSKQRALSTLLP